MVISYKFYTLITIVKSYFKYLYRNLVKYQSMYDNILSKSKGDIKKKQPTVIDLKVVGFKFRNLTFYVFLSQHDKIHGTFSLMLSFQFSIHSFLKFLSSFAISRCVFSFFKIKSKSPDNHFFFSFI